MRKRWKLLHPTRPKIDEEPPVHFEGKWETVAPAICADYVASERSYKFAETSDEALDQALALSEMMAIIYEERNRDSIPADERLFPHLNTRQDFYEAAIVAFLKSIGEQDPEAIFAALRAGGAGGRHRQNMTGLYAANTFVGAAATATPDLTAKAALTGVRMLIHMGMCYAAVKSGDERFNLAQAEDMMSKGRADASPSAKNAPHVLRASLAVMMGLTNANRTRQAIKDARKIWEDLPADVDPDVKQAAWDELEFANAKMCYKLDLKGQYKASSESMKTEYRGSERALYNSILNGVVTLGGGVPLGILGGIGVVAPPITAPLSAGIGLFVLGAYVGFQLSSGPGKDAEAKGKRAIVALAKSMDVLKEDSAPVYKERAEAFALYRKEKRCPAFSSKATREAKKRDARAALMERLEAITEREANAEIHNTPKGNWVAYGAYKRSQEAPAGDGNPNENQFNETEFKETLAANFDLQKISNLWKAPMRMRMELAERTLRGSFSRLFADIAKCDNHKTLLGLKTKLGQVLEDMVHFDLSRRYMEAAVKADDEREVLLARAAESFKKIKNEKLHTLFCGDATDQMNAEYDVKSQFIGEADRYSMTIMGSLLPGLAATTGVIATDLATSGVRAGGGTIGKIDDYKNLQIMNGAMVPTVAYANGVRSAMKANRFDTHYADTNYQASRMENYLVFGLAYDPVLREEADHLAMNLELDNQAVQEKLDPQLIQNAVDKLVKRIQDEKVDAQIRGKKDFVMPKNIVIYGRTMQGAGVGNAIVKDSGMELTLDDTTTYHAMQRTKLSDRITYHAKRAGGNLRMAGVSVGGPIVQGTGAAMRLWQTRKPMNEMRDKIAPEVRATIHEKARKDAEEEVWFDAEEEIEIWHDAEG